MKYELRPMDAGEILDRSLKIYLQNFGLLFAIALVVTLPLMALTGVTVSALGLRDFDPASQDPAMAVDHFGSILGFALFMVVAASLLGTLTQGALFQALSDLYLGRRASMGGAFRKAFSRLPSLLGASVLFNLAAGIGIIPCCAGFLFVYATLGVAIPAVMLEGQGAVDGLRRSWNLTKGHRGRVLGTLLVALAVIMVWSYLAGFALQYSHLDYLYQNVLGQLAGAAVQPFLAVVTILLYYDLRVRKEAFDLEVLARESGGGGKAG